MAYHLQINGSSKEFNQIVKITLRFFVYALKNPCFWLVILPHIESFLNNIFLLTTSQMLKKIAYTFLLRQPLYLLLAAYEL